MEKNIEGGTPQSTISINFVTSYFKEILS